MYNKTSLYKPVQEVVLSQKYKSSTWSKYRVMASCTLLNQLSSEQSTATLNICGVLSTLLICLVVNINCHISIWSQP